MPIRSSSTYFFSRLASNFLIMFLPCYQPRHQTFSHSTQDNIDLDLLPCLLSYKINNQMHCSHFCKTLRQCLMFHTLRGFLFTTVSQIHPRTELCHCSCLLWGGTFTSCKSIICFLLSQKTEIFHRELALSS